MKTTNTAHLSRRQFLTGILPSCAVISLGCSSGLLLASQEQPADAPHKFLREMDRKLTYKRWMQQRHSKYIGLLKHLEKAVGKEELHDMLKKASFMDNVALGKRLARRIPDMKTFAAPFRNENSGVGRTIVREIVEDSDEVFEMKITECLTEVIFREADALELGYACVCHADFGLPEGLDINIKLIRDKTLMQGHDCCNHRYVWERG